MFKKLGSKLHMGSIDKRFVLAVTALAWLAIGSSAAFGLRGAETFAAPFAAPTLTSVTPATGVQSTNILVTLIGTDFDGGNFAIDTGGADIVATAVQVVNATTATAGFAISGTATLGAHSISVTTNGGASGSQTFTVTVAPAPTLTSMTPTSGSLGAAVPVTLTGTSLNFGGLSINAGAGITVYPINVVSATTVTATFTIGLNAAQGLRTVSATTNGGTTGTVNFTVNPERPALTGITPVNGVPGTSVTVTLTGGNFIPDGLLVAISGTNITVDPPVLVNSNVITTTLNLASNAVFGVRTVTVTTSGGVSSSVSFSVVPPTPTLSTATPLTGRRGTSVPVTVTGTNFATGASMIVSAGAGITGGTAVVTGTTFATATLVIGLGAVEGDRSIVVAHTGGTSNALTFTVQAPPAPTLISINPISGSQSTNVAVTLLGTNFQMGGFTINPGADITVVGTPVINGAGSQATATLAIGAGAALGARNITISTVSGETSPVSFTVRPPLPTLTSLSPNFGTQGTSPTITLTGTNFGAGGLAVLVTGTTSVTAGSAVLVSSTTATVTLTIDPTIRAPFNANIAVTTDGGTSGTLVFTARPPLPTLTSVSPSSGRRATTQAVTLTGTGFVSGAGATIVNAGSGITVTGLSIINTISATANFVINVNSTEGPRDIVVVTAGGTSAPFTFTVDPPGTPTLSNITPTSGTQASAVAVTLTGTNYTAGLQFRPFLTGTSTPDPGIVVSGVAFSTTSGIGTATLTIGLTATVGVHDIRVITAGGTSNAVAFTVDPLALPVVSTVYASIFTPFPVSPQPQAVATIVTPPQGQRGRTPALPTSVPVTIQGSNFGPSAATNRVSVEGGTVGITASAFTPTAGINGIELRGTLTVSSAATEGIRGLTVNTDVGTSTPSDFTVTGPVPSLSTISPATLLQGDTTLVTVTGSNFATTASNPGAYLAIRIASGQLTGVSVTGTGNTWGVGTQTGGVPDAGPVQLIDDNTIVVSITVDAAASLGNRTVRVGTGNGMSITGSAVPDIVQFSVVSPNPTLTRVTPNGAPQGASLTVTLNGTNFDKGTPGSFAVEMAGTYNVLTDVTFSNPVVVGATTATVDVVVTAGALKERRPLRVITSIGSGQLANAFTVFNDIPTLSDISPANGGQGKTVPITIQGTNFLPGAGGAGLSLQVGPGITVGALTVNAAGDQATGTLTILPSAGNAGTIATAGPRDMTVTTGAGTSGLFSFTVDPAPVPVVGSVTPAVGIQTRAVPITVFGSNFVNGAIVTLEPANDIFRGASTVNAGGTGITVTLTIGTSATPGVRDLLVTTAGGTSTLAGAFTIEAAAVPTLTSVTPNSGIVTRVVPITLVGTDFLPGSIVSFNPPDNITKSTPVVNASGTGITLTVTIGTFAAAGDRTITVNTAGGTTNTVTFTVVVPTPALTSITPALGEAGSNPFTVTLVGSGFIPGAIVSFSPSADIVKGSPVVNAAGTGITMTVTIATAAALGDRTVTVNTVGGTSGTATFKVLAVGLPTFTSMSPSQGSQGATGLVVTLVGNNFEGGSFSVIGTAGSGAVGLTISNFVVSSTSLAFMTLNIAADAPPGTHPLFVSTLSGTSATRIFNVLAVPTLTSITPNTGLQGAIVPVTLTGSNLGPGLTFQPGANITVSAIVSGTTTATATLTIGSGAAVGVRGITVATAGGTSAPANFTVQAPPTPVLTSVTPTAGRAGQSIPVTIAGSNFVAGMTIRPLLGSTLDTNFTVTSLVMSNSTQATATLNIGNNAVIGDRNLTVNTVAGTSNSVTFTVVQPFPPTLTSMNPAAGATGSTVTVTLTGTNLSPSGFAVNAGANITLTGFSTSGTGTSATATLDIGSGATIGPRSLTVSTVSGASGNLIFTVTPPAVTYSSITPSTVLQGTPSQLVTLTGTNFDGGLTLNTTTANITVSGLDVVSSTQATALLTIAGGATVRSYATFLTTAFTTSGTVSFAILPPSPTLSSITPTSGTQGTTVPVTLSGNNFVSSAFGTTLVDVSGANITASSIVVVNGTTLRANLIIDESAAIGARVVTVSTSGGVSSGVSFTVLAAQTPTFSSIIPPYGARGAMMQVTLIGTNFVSGLDADAGANITVSNVVVVSSTSATATFFIDVAAVLGARTVTLSTVGGTSNSVSFTVLAAQSKNQFDLNGDGKADLLWVDPTTGQTAYWLMNGDVLTSAGVLVTDPNWRAAATADFNGDGKTDIVWYNPATGGTAIWLMDGGTTLSSVSLLVDPDWKVTGAADLNGDGKADLLWRDGASGQSAYWLMDGAVKSGSGLLVSDTNWEVAFTPDLNGDGKADLVWRNASAGQTAYWLMDGGTVLSSAPLLTDLDWKAVFTPDLNGDGKADVIWQNAASGNTAYWLLDDGAFSSGGALAASPDWKVLRTPDLNGDGKSDLIWRNGTTREVVYVLMNGGATVGSGLLVASSAASWTLTGTVDLNADGKADLIWHNADSGETVDWLLDGGVKIGGVSLLTAPGWKTLIAGQPGGAGITGAYPKQVRHDMIDLNGDGKSDLLWQNTGAGQTEYWEMNGGYLTSSMLLLSNVNWKVTFTPDLNGDGRTDLLWYNSSTHQTAYWMMNGGAWASISGLLTDDNWKVVFTPDLNGDGKSDLLWRNDATGQTGYWLMNGGVPFSVGVLPISSNWKATFTPDLNGDGKSDVIWYDEAAGQTAYWLMNGGAPTSAGPLLTDANWKVAFTPDLDGDGKSDLIWYNGLTNQTVFWLMNGGVLTSTGILYSGPNWKVVAVPDVDGDGKSDLIWNNASTGETAYWLMSGGTKTSSELLLTNTNWNVIATGDFNGDGKVDLVWYNQSTGQTAFWLMRANVPGQVGILRTDFTWNVFVSQ